MSSKMLIAGASALMLLAVAACDEAEPTPDPALAFCDSVEVLAESVDALDALGASSTVDEVQAGIDAVAEAATEVKDSAGDLAESQVEAIETAVGDLESYRDDIDDTQTMEQVVAGLVDQLAAIKQARVEAGTVHCGLTEAEAAAGEAQEAAATMAAEVQDAAEEAGDQVEEAVAEVGDQVEEAAEALESPAA